MSFAIKEWIESLKMPTKKSKSLERMLAERDELETRLRQAKAANRTSEIKEIKDKKRKLKQEIKIYTSIEKDNERYGYHAPDDY